MTRTRIPSSPPSDNSSSSSKDQDRLLPIANVSRIMKKSLPANAKISKEAKETVQECVSEFISFVTGEASEKCQREKRKTINGDDLLWAMTTLGFENYVVPLKAYLSKYREREGEGEKNSMAKQEDDDDDHGCDHHHNQDGSKIMMNGSLQGFNYSGDIYSHDHGEVVVGYSESLMRNGGGLEIGNGKRAMAATTSLIHHGVEW